MMLDDTLPLTLQYQLRTALFEKIKSGDWPSGYMIPSERELCDEYGVSRITVREVLKNLVQEGYLIRKQGKGTFVSSPKFEQQLTSYYSLSKEIEQRNLKSEFKILAFNRIESDFSMQQYLNLKSKEPVFEIIRVRYIGEETFAYERAIIPCIFLKGVTKEELDTKGLYPSILKYSGEIPEEAEESFEAINCPDEIATIMNLKKKSAVFHVIRITKSVDKIIELCESFIVGEKYSYKHVIKKK